MDAFEVQTLGGIWQVVALKDRHCAGDPVARVDYQPADLPLCTEGQQQLDSHVYGG